MSIENFDWQGYMSDIGYAPEQIPNEINDEDLQWLYGLWARDLMEKINYDVKRDPFLSTAKEKRSEARKRFLYYAPDLAHFFGDEVQPNDPNSTYDPEAFRQHVINNEVQNANLGYYLDTFAASRINEDTDVKYPWLKGLTKDQFKRHFMEQQDIDEAWTSVDDIRNGNFGTLSAKYQEQLARQQGLKGNEKSGHMAALKQGWYEFEKLFGYTAGTLGDATGIQWLSDIGNEIAQNVIQKSDAYNYQSKYNESLADTIKNQGFMAAGGKILNMAEENWATTAAPLALAAIGKILSTYAHVPQPLADAATRAVAANVVRRQGANLLRRASQLAYASSAALSGLEIGGVRAELEEHGKYDPNNVADVVAAGLVSSSLDFVGNVAAMKGIGITASRLWTHRLAVNEARARLAREIAEDQAKSFTHRVLSAMAIEGVTEGLQEIPAMVVGARRGIEYTPKQVRDRIIDAAAVGAFMGAGIRAGEIALEKYHRGDGDDTPTPTSTEQEPGETPEAAPQTEPQPPPPGFDGAIPPFVTWRQMENGFSVHDEFNVGYGATHEEAARNFIDNANKGRVDIDPNRITFVPGSQAGESWVIARYGENGKNSVKVIGQDKERYIRKIIELHNDPNNAVNLQGDNVFRTDEFRSNNPQLNEDEFIRSILEQKKTKFGSGSRVTAARRDTVDIPVSFDALPRGERPGTYVTFNLDEDTRSSLRDKGFTILSEPRSKKKGRVQVLRLHRDGFIYTVTLTNNESDQGAHANVKAESIYNLVHGKKGGGFSFEGDIDEQVLRVVDTDAVTNLSTSREVKYAVTLSPTLRPGFIEIDRKITPEGREGFTFDPRDVLKKRVEAAKGKIENLGERNISYTSGGETTRLDITADGRVLVSRDGRFIGDYDFVAGDIGDGIERAIVQSSRIEGQQLFHVVDIPEELQFEGRVTFVYRDDLIGGKVTREYFAIKNDGSVHFIPPAKMNYVDKLLRLPHIQNLNDARDVFGHQFIEFYALPEFYNDGEVRQFVGFKTENNLLPAVNLEDPALHRFDDMQADELISAGYNEDFVKVYAIIAPNGEIVRATTEEGVDAFISDIKNYANIIDDSEWNPSSRGESIFGDAYNEQGRYTERDLYDKVYSVEEIYVNDDGTPFTDEDFNSDSDEIRKTTKRIVQRIKDTISNSRNINFDKNILDEFESRANELSRKFTFFDNYTSQQASQYFSSAREFNRNVREIFYRARIAQALLHIDLHLKELGSIVNESELNSLIDQVGTFQYSDTMEQLREKAVQAESIALRLEEAHVDFMRSSQPTQTTDVFWEAIYPSSTGYNYGSFVNRIHSEGTDFRFSRAAETPRVQRKINLLDELNNDIGTFTLNEMLERGLRGESGGLVILPDQEAAHEIERRFTTDATQPYYDNAGLIQGFVAPDGIMYLVEDGIVDGKGRQIILHEYGVHARKFGMSDAEFQEVVQGIKARRDEKSAEGNFIRNCITRARRANRNMSEDNPIFWEEVAAYAVEDGYHLADTGIVGRMQTWMKNWLWRFGVIDASAFHYQDFVNMAQGMLGNPGPLSFFDGTHDYTKYQDSWKNLPKFSRTILAEDSPDREEFAQRTYRRLRGLDDAIDRERNGEDADSIEQATDWRRNDQGDWNFRYSVAGEIGAARLDALEEVTTRMDNLVVARDMEQAGKDTKAIKFATGWYRGKDGKWRYEISNNLDKLTDEFEKIALRIVSYDVNRYFNKEGIAPYYIENLIEKEGKGDFLRNIADSYEPLNPAIIFDKANYKMSEIFSSPNLFGAYPELADMTVYITGILFGHDTVAFYSSNDKTITLNERFVTEYILNKLGLESVRAEDMRNSLLHEIQHYIQDVEGFSRGTSVHYLQKKLQDSESYKIIESYEDEKNKIEKELRGRDASYLKRYRNYLSRIYYLLFLDFINNNDNYHFNENGVLVWNNDDEPVTIAASDTFYHYRIDGDEVITKDNLKNIIDRLLEVQIFNIGYAPPISLASSYVFKNPTLPIIYGDFTEYIYNNFDNYFGTEESEFVSEIEEKEKRIVFLQEKINEEYIKFFGKEGITSSISAYRASAGENEARMVEKRSALTNEGLRDRYIEEDMNIPLGNQIDTDVFYDEVISDSLVRYSRATAEDLKPYSSFINTLENDLVSQRISGVPNEGDTVLYQRGDVNEFITRDSLYTIEDADDYYPDLEQRWIDYHRDDSESNFVRYSRSIPETNGFRYSFISEDAARRLDEATGVTTRIDEWRIATQMEANGATEDEIKLATNWSRGRDGIWRYEVSDRWMQVSIPVLRDKRPTLKKLKEKLTETYKRVSDEGGWEEYYKAKDDLINFYVNITEHDDPNEVTALSNIIVHRELFQAYPQLQFIEFRFVDDRKENSVGSVIDNSILEVNIGRIIKYRSSVKKIEDDIKRTIIHEVQHLIQNFSGFAKGGNPEMFETISEIERKKNVATAYDASVDGIKEFERIFLNEKNFNSFLKSNPQLTEGEIENLRRTLFDKFPRPSYPTDLREFVGDSFYKFLKKKVSYKKIPIDDYWKDLTDAFNGMKILQHFYSRNSHWKYRRLLGEIEARLAERRRSLTEEQLRNTPISLSEREEDILSTRDMVDPVSLLPLDYIRLRGNVQTPFNFRYSRDVSDEEINAVLKENDTYGNIRYSRAGEDSNYIIKYSFVGKEAAANLSSKGWKVNGKTPLELYEIYKTMQGDGEEPRKIKKETGWEYDPVNKEDKFEIEDGEIKKNKKPIKDYYSKKGDEYYYLEDLLDAPVLFTAYPKMRKAKIYARKTSDGALGEASANSMNIPGRFWEAKRKVYGLTDSKLVKEILFHEIQHLIQYHEPSFTEGSATYMFDSAYPTRDDKYDAYRRTRGEVEARNTARRLNLSLKERWNSLSEDTEEKDIPRGKQFTIERYFFNRRRGYTTRFSRAATIDDVPQTARQRGTQVPNAPGMYKMSDGSLHIEPSELPVGFESETILYAAIAVSDPAKEEPKIAELRGLILTDPDLMRETDRMMRERNDTNEDHRLGYAVSLILEAYDPTSDIYQQTVDAFHEAVSKATGGAYQNLILDTGQIEAAAHAAAGIPYEPLLTAPQETVPTPRPNTADMEHLRRQEMFAASDAQRAEMQVGEDGRAYISTDDSDVDVVFESKVNTPFDTGRLVDDVLIGASRQGEDDDFYNHLADSPHHGTQEPLDSGRFALPADQHRLEVERFLADSIPEHIWRRVEILWEDNAENNAILGNALGLFKPRSWKNKNIFIKGWNRSFGQVVRTAAREASRFGWGMWQNRDFRRAITEFYDMFQAKIYDELRPYYNQMGITDPAQLSDGQKIYMVQTFFSKMNQSLFTDDQGNMGDLLGISQTEYNRILADVRSGVAAQERDLSAFVEGVANDPELAKRFAAEMLRMTMEASTKMGVHFTYERSSRLGGKDRIRVFTNEWGTYRRKIPNTRFGLAAEEIKNNLRWWRERFNAGEGAEKFARQMMRNLPMGMKYPLKWMHLYVPHARLGDTTLGRASQMISRVWQRIGDTSGTTLARDYALMEDIHGILRVHNYDPLMADDMGNRTYRQFFQGLGITSEKDLKKADMADAIVTTAERLKTEGEARIRETIMETGLSLWNRMLEADFSQREINDMVNRFEGYRQRFMLDHYSHRMYEAFTPEGKRELSMLLNYLRRDPRTGEHTLAKRAKEARDAIARAQARYGAATSEFYRETKEARDDLRRWERLQHLWNREMGNAKKYKGLVGAELNAKVVEGMERYILAIVSDSKTHGRFDPQAVPHYNAISAQKARTLDPNNPLDKELMDFLLEIKDPIRKAVYTLDQQRQLITKLEFNKELGEYLLDNNMAGLRSQPDADGLARDLAHMETGSFLEYVNVDPEFMPEIKAEWENMQKVSDTVLSGLTDAVKANSTVYSLRLMMNNYIGNASMLLASGHIWRFKDYLTAGEVIRKQFLDRFTYGAKDPSDFAKMILREMEQNMVTGGSGTEMSVFQLNKGAHERFVQTMTQMLYAVTPLTKRGKFKMDNFVAKLLEKARAFYTYGDEWVKPLIYLNNRASAIAKYQAVEKRYDGETEEDYQERVLKKAIEEASEQTIRETVSWENSPFFVRQLSTRSVRFFAPDFLLHNFQMLRITASNYVRLANIWNELRNFDPSQMNPDKVEAYRSELKKEFVRRGIGGAMTAGVYAGLIGATGSCMAYIPYMMNTLMAAIDGEDDKDKDNTFFNPQEWEGAQRILNYKTGGDNFFVPAWRHDGKIYAWNYGRASVMLTHAITRPATENPEFTDYAAQFFKNIVAIGGGTIAQEIVNNFQGKDKWGRDIGVEAGWWRIFDRVFVPGAVKQLMDMSVGYPGSDNPYREGKAIKMSDAVGITVNAYDMRDIVNELAWDMARVGSNSQNVVRKSFVKRLTQSDALSDSDVASMIGDMREDNARHMDRANYLLTGLRQMGMENKELQHWLTTSRKDAGNILSKKQATAFLKGHNVYDDALVTYLKNKRNNLAKGKDDVRMSREELGVVLQNYDKAIRIYSQALRPQ